MIHSQDHYVAILQSLQGLTNHLFPNSRIHFFALGFSLKEIEFLKLFQEKYYKRYLLNQMIEFLNSYSEDPCQLSFIKSLQNILLLVDSSVNHIIQEFTKLSLMEDNRKQRIIYIYKETALHRNIIDWFYDLIASVELKEISFHEAPENQEVFEIISKYEDSELWKAFFPKNYDLVNLLTESFEKSFTTIKQLNSMELMKGPSSSFSFQSFYQPIPPASAASHHLKSDYLRCTLFFYCCQSVMISVINTNVIQSSLQFSSLELKNIGQYQEIIEFFLKFSIQDIFASTSLSSSSSMNISKELSSSLMNDMSSTLQIYIYSMIVKLLIISFQSHSFSNDPMNTCSALQKEQIDQLQYYSQSLVQHFFTSMNPFDFLNQLDSSLPSSGISETNPAVPGDIARGIKLLLNLGSVSPFVPGVTQKKIPPYQPPAKPVPRFQQNLQPEASVRPDTHIVENASIKAKPASTTFIGFVEREVDPLLMLEAEDYLKKKYELLMLEVEKRRAKAQWQIKRLKSLPDARKKLQKLFESEDEEYTKELIKLNRIRPWMKKTLQEIILAEQEQELLQKQQAQGENEEKRDTSMLMTIDVPDDISDLTSIDTSMELPPSMINNVVVPAVPPALQTTMTVASSISDSLTGKVTIPVAVGKSPQKEPAMPVILEEAMESKSIQEDFPRNFEGNGEKEEFVKDQLPTDSSDNKVTILDEKSRTVTEEERLPIEELQNEEFSIKRRRDPRDNCYDRIIQEFYSDYSNITHAMNQESLFEILSSYLPFSLLCLTANTKAITFSKDSKTIPEDNNEDDNEMKILENYARDYSSLSLYNCHQKKDILKFFHRSLNQRSKLHEQSNLSEDFFHSLIVEKNILYEITGNFSFKYFQFLSSFQLMSSYDAQINAIIFHYLFTSSSSSSSSSSLTNYNSQLKSSSSLIAQQNLFLHLSIIQQYFLVSLKRNFLYELSSELINTAFPTYQESYYDYLMNRWQLLLAKQTIKDQSKLQTTTKQKSFSSLSSTTHSTSSFALLSFRKKGIRSLPKIWTNRNIYLTMEKLLKSNLSSIAPISIVKTKTKEEDNGDNGNDQDEAGGDKNNNQYFSIFSSEMIQFRSLVNFHISNEKNNHHLDSNDENDDDDNNRMVDDHDESEEAEEKREYSFWSRFLSIAHLSSLQIEYKVFWPINIFIHSQFLSKINSFTTRYLIILQYNHTYQLLWKELKELIKKPSFLPNDYHGPIPLTMKNAIQQTNNYYRLFNIYYYQLGNIIQSFYAYFNNRIMNSNYHLFHYLIHFYSNFLAQKDSASIPSSSSSSPQQQPPQQERTRTTPTPSPFSPSNSNAFFSSTDLSTVIAILDSYSDELFEASFQFQTSSSINSNPQQQEDKETSSQSPSIPPTFHELQELIEKNNFHRINILSMIKFTLQEILEECSECLIYSFMIIMKEQFYHSLQENDLQDYLSKELHRFMMNNNNNNTKKSSIDPKQLKEERMKFLYERLESYHLLSIPSSDQRMQKVLSKMKFHLLKINELIKRLHWYGKKFYHVQSMGATASYHQQQQQQQQQHEEGQSPQRSSLHYKNHIQTLLMHLQPC